MVLLLAIGAGIVLWLLHKYGLANVVHILQRVRMVWIAAGILVYYAGVLVRAVKWHWLIARVGHQVGFGGFLPMYCVISMAGTITPMRSGESLAPFLFRKYLHASIGGGFSVILLDRLFECVSLALLMSIAVIYVLFSFNVSVLLARGLMLSFAVLLIVIGLLFVLLRQQMWTTLILKGLKSLMEKRKAPAILLRVVQGLEREIHCFYVAVAHLSHHRVFVFLILLTFLAWLFEIGAFYCIVRSVTDAPFLVIASSQAIAAGIALASFIPGGIGSGTISFVYLFSLAGYSGTTATAAALISPVVFLGSMFICGSLSAVILKRHSVPDQAQK